MSQTQSRTLPGPSIADSLGTLSADLLLVFPPFGRLVVSMENIGIEYVASSAREHGFTVELINAGLHGLTTEQICRIVRTASIRVLGVSAIHWTLESGLAIAEAAKRADPGCHVILGGLEAALNSRAILERYDCVDSICLGEGERVIVGLLSHLEAGTDWRGLPGIAYRRDGRRFAECGASAPGTRGAAREGDTVANQPSLLIRDLDGLPKPARDDIHAVGELGGPVTISTSRGCFGHCTFCSVRSFYALSQGERWRGRSPSSVVSEIKSIHDAFGTTLFSFIDETVVGPGPLGVERVLDIARGIMDAGLKIEFFLTIRADQVARDVFEVLKDAGLRKVEIGIESMAASQLHRYGKSAGVEDNRKALAVLEELGISSEAFMIPFDSQVSYDELRTNLRFYRERFLSHRDRYDVSPLTMGDYVYPYPGTEMKGLYEGLGLLGAGYYSPFQAVDPTITRVQRMVHTFISLVQPAFPMSYSGLGNLWVNSAGLPEEVYTELCTIASDIGMLNADFIEWCCAWSADAAPPDRDAIGSFVDLADGFRARVRKIVDVFGRHRSRPTATLGFASPFSEDLYRFGRARRMEIIERQLGSPMSSTEAMGRLVELCTTDGWMGAP